LKLYEDGKKKRLNYNPTEKNQDCTFQPLTLEKFKRIQKNGSQPSQQKFKVSLKGGQTISTTKEDIKIKGAEKLIHRMQEGRRKKEEKEKAFDELGKLKNPY